MKDPIFHIGCEPSELDLSQFVKHLPHQRLTESDHVKSISQHSHRDAEDDYLQLVDFGVIQLLDPSG